MVEPIKLLQDSLGTLFWNEVAAAWQNDALMIGRYHRHELANALTQSLFSTDCDNRLLNLVSRDRQSLCHGDESSAVDAERSEDAFGSEEGTQVFVDCFRRDRLMFRDGIATIEPVKEFPFFADDESFGDTWRERKDPPSHAASCHCMRREGDDLFKDRLQHYRRSHIVRYQC